MILRPFTIDDVPIILSWIKDKTAFRKWSADRYPVYPPKPEDMLAQYDSDVIFPYTAIDDEGKVVGHIMLRYPEPSKTVIQVVNRHSARLWTWFLICVLRQRQTRIGLRVMLSVMPLTRQDL